jgi:hypothetical protein
MLENIEAHKSRAPSPAPPPPAASISASDVAAAIESIGPLYIPYRKAFIDNGVDGTMLADWRGRSDEDLLRILTDDLGIVSSLHSRRVLLELKKLWGGNSP